jgi:hypothetical protein
MEPPLEPMTVSHASVHMENFTDGPRVNIETYPCAHPNGVIEVEIGADFAGFGFSLEPEEARALAQQLTQAYSYVSAANQ